MGKKSNESPDNELTPHFLTQQLSREKPARLFPNKDGKQVSVITVV